MIYLIAVLIIGFLVFAMFMILKNTVNRINNQTKSYFVETAVVVTLAPTYFSSDSAVTTP